MDRKAPKSLFSVPCPVFDQASSIFTDATASSTHCTRCEKKVAILAGKTLLEISEFMRSNPGSCIIIGGKMDCRPDGPDQIS
jgi:hypothetical protein